jgi:signal transduction histidine kinase/ligand-binding sensor domain-containing protein
MRLAFVVIFFSFALRSFAQELKFHEYRVEHGLPSDVIKAVAQDTLGFIWIATDEGLVKFDGRRFTTYKQALSNQYAKGFLLTWDKKLLAFGDLDVVEIQNKIDTVVFVSLLKGFRTPTDSTVWYPKAIYEDYYGSLWFAEPQSVTRYDSRGLKRFDFGNENRSTVFIRSFSFFENPQHEFFTNSYDGKVFRYSPETDSFIPLGQTFPNPVNHVLIRDSVMFIAAATGVYSARFANSTFTEIKKICDVPDASHLVADVNNTMWVSSYGQFNYRFRYDNAGAHDLLKQDFKFPGTNRSFVSREGDLWSATDKGLVLIQKNIFRIADDNSNTQFIESVTRDERSNTLYYATKESIVSIGQADGKFVRKVVYNNKKSYFQSLQFGSNGLWASNAFGVFLFRDEKLVKTWDFSQEGNFIHDILLDSQNNLWIGQAGNNQVIVIDSNLKVNRIPVPFTSENDLFLLREGNGGIYLASNGATSYLFFKPENKSFRNISQQPGFKILNDLKTNDLAIDGDSLWLASTEGLLLYADSVLTRIDLGEKFTSLSVSSVEMLDKNNLLFANSFGLFRYNIRTKEFWLFDENTGLPSNTITDQGLFIDGHGRLWVGTSSGLGYTDESIANNQKTPKPFCVEVKVNGLAKKFIEGLQIPYAAFVDMQFTSVSFPEKVEMQWRFVRDSLWRTLPNGELILSDVTSGNFEVVVRAKNIGMSWSDLTSVKFVVTKPYWQTAGFIFFVLILIVFISWISYMISARMMEKRKSLLQSLINARTRELQEVNEELMLRNSELDRFVYSASHDLSAPLKSMMGLINVARMEKPGPSQEKYLLMMERSVAKLDQFIREVVTYSRNNRTPLHLERFSFKEFVQNILQDYQYSPNFNKISFTTEDQTGAEMVCDPTRLKIILNNLISNAIHFHRYYGNVKPFVKISLTIERGNYIVRVHDNGKGISDKHLSKIFDMFYRASEDSQGSGLGLYILKESVTKLEGTIHVISAVDEGTTFTIELPVRLIPTEMRSTGS